MNPAPWSTQPITGAQHDAWMAEEAEVRAAFREKVRAEFGGPRINEPVILDEDGAARDFTARYLRSIRSM